MSDDRPDSNLSSLSWLERLTGALSGEPKTREQLVEMLRDAEDRNLFDADALSMIEGVLQVAEMRVRDIMVPRPQMVCIDADQAPEEFVATVISSAHSRFPVIGDNRDEVDGILLAKDLLAHFAEGGRRPFDLREAMRAAVFVPESKRLNVLLGEFRASRNHMAIVVDEYNGVAGLVTIEDVLEQIVGEIDDEHDAAEELYIRPRSNGDYLVKALTPIEDFNAYFEVEFSDEEFDTIGGLVVQSFGRLPTRGEITQFGSFEFEVLRADKRRVNLVLLRRLDDE
ncbi:MAG: transporter associated domain-containing protein [Pseudomonadota bacterium]